MKELNVKGNIEKLASVATSLDSKSPDLADQIDKISASYLSIAKQAQYVGVQGYALRNSRCFEKCLRHKRAQSNMAYDRIWTACHEEYMAALNDPKNETWNKYASKQEPKQEMNIPAELVRSADALLDLSKQLEGTPEGEELSKVANQLVKEAGLFDFLTYLSSGLNTVSQHLGAVDRIVQSGMASIAGAKEDPTVARKVKTEVFNQLGISIDDLSTLQSAHPRTKKVTDFIVKTLAPLRGQVGKTSSMNELISTLQNISNTLQELKSKVFGGKLEREVADAGDITQNQQSPAQQPAAAPQAQPSQQPAAQQPKAQPAAPSAGRGRLQNALQSLLNDASLFGKNQLLQLLENAGIKVKQQIF